MNKFLIAFGAFLWIAPIATAQETTSAVANPTASPALSAAGTPGTATVEQVVVTSQELDISREAIVPSLGATRYTVGPDRLDSQAQGESAPFNQTILRFPGVAQDSFSQLHVRGEHANLQYRIDDVLLPESIPGFGQELETRFADSVSLITGALPAQFGFRNTGVIDIHTKNGAVFQQGEASMFVGSFDTIKESLEYGGVLGKLSYFGTESYLHDGIGIENPTRSSSPIHDDTDQYKLFGYSSYIFDPTSRLTLLISGNHSDFQIPNTPGLTPAFTVGTRSTFDSAKLDENQSEDSTYAILTYQKHVGDFSFQASAFNRYSAILFRPDDVGDLIFNGVASRVDRGILSNGIEFDSSYKLTDQHTLRAGFIFTEGYATVDTVTLVFPVDENGHQTSTVPLRIVDNHDKYGYFYGFYLQDEWKPFEQLTINFGGRLDFVNAFVDENQLSPRINVVYEPFKATTLHAGYEWARGTNVSSAQFLFDPDEFAYIKKNWVFLDHDQRFTGSAGVSYTWNDWRLAIDGLYGNGLRRGFANTQKNHPYETFNVSLSRRIQITAKTAVKIRFDVVNILDTIYELRDGSGIGVGAPQFGQRRGFYGTVAYDF